LRDVGWAKSLAPVARVGTALRRFCPRGAVVRCAVPTLLLAIISSAHAQTYPTHPIRVIVGPGPDIVARLFAPKLTEALGQQVVVEPRPGAGGVIAAQSVANAAPDGYLLLQATASYTINTAMGTLPLDLAKDFAPIALVSTMPGFAVIGWNGFVAPKGTPAVVIARLDAALAAGLDDAALRQRLAAAGYETAAKSTPLEFAAFIAADTARWLDLVAKTRMKSN